MLFSFIRISTHPIYKCHFQHGFSSPPDYSCYFSCALWHHPFPAAQPATSHPASRPASQPSGQPAEPASPASQPASEQDASQPTSQPGSWPAALSQARCLRAPGRRRFRMFVYEPGYTYHLYISFRATREACPCLSAHPANPRSDKINASWLMAQE